MAQGEWSISLDWAAQVTNARVHGPAGTAVNGVGTDTRQNLDGKLFIALKGDRFDAHDFVAEAVKAGANALLVHRSPRDLASIPARVTVLEVSNTLASLQDLARAWRRRCGYKVIGITGSNGKTSTKEFTATLLKSHFRVHASQGSFNNHWGVPLSLLGAGPDCQVVVQEMGMNHAGEITRLAAIAEPDITVVTMVGRAHIGELGSQEAVAAAKEELYLAAPRSEMIFNLDNEWTSAMLERQRRRGGAKRILTFSSFRSDVNVTLRVERMPSFELELSGQIGGESGRVKVPVVGRHNVVNLMAAATAALALEVPAAAIWSDLAKCRGSWGRNQIVRLKSGATAIFDGYNANPESMAALLKNLYEFDVPGKKVVVLGAMFELGAEAPKAHRELGETVARGGVDVVWFFGPNAADFRAGLEAEGFSKTSFISDSYQEELARKVGSMLNPTDVAVVKGSRAMKMERVLEEWQPLDFDTHSSQPR